MKALLVGGGGREHAIAHKLCQSPQLEHLYVAPGNGGTARLAKAENVAIGAEDIPALLAFAREHAIDLTVVGPEAPLVAGIVDAFQAAGLRIFGPTRAAAQLEGSKAFSKRFMQRWQIPTGQAEIFDDFDDAMRYMRAIDFVPVIKASGLAAEGAPYVGVLYAGLMLTPQGPRVLEYNCRLGDPETQVLLPLLESDLVEVLSACIDGALDQVHLRWRKASAVTVVMASEGYPDEYRTGLEIFGINDAEATGCTVYQAGTRLKDGRLVTAGGRVLAVTATAPTVEHAARRAYIGVQRINFAGAHYRRDIGLPLRAQAKPAGRPAATRKAKRS